MPSVLAFSFALASRSARSLSVLASVASNTALYSAIAAEGARASQCGTPPPHPPWGQLCSYERQSAASIFPLDEMIDANQPAS